MKNYRFSFISIFNIHTEVILEDNLLITRQIRNDEIGKNANGQKQIFNELPGFKILL